MLVKATVMSSKLRVAIKELGRIASPGEQFEVSSIRYKVLAGNNKYNAVFVTKVEEEPKEEKPTKKSKPSKRKEEQVVEENDTTEIS